MGGELALIDAIPIEETTRLAIVGAGGKTCLMFELAKEWSGKTIFVTTTTHLGIEQSLFADHHLVFTDDDFYLKLPDACRRYKIILITGPATSDQTRWSGLTSAQMRQLSKFAEENGIPILVEADGSRGIPIKAPDDHEPVIPEQSNAVAVVVGLSALGTEINEKNVHRVEKFIDITGKVTGDLISEDAIASMLKNTLGGLKNIPENAKRYVVLNQADSMKQIDSGMRIAILSKPFFDKIIICSLKPIIDIYKCVSNTAGIILAAGEAARFGKTKQLLAWKESTITYAVCKTAIAAGLDPVIVVVGSNSGEVKKSLSTLPVIIVENDNWASGQASSLKVGITSIPEHTGAAVFLMADQPQIQSELIQELVTAHQKTLAPIIYPTFGGQRGNPVLFDRRTFRDLLNLSGDSGGKQIFTKYPIIAIDWKDDSILMDIDIHDDYLLLKERYHG